MELTGKRTVITGAASGIGRATAEKFLGQGAVVAALDRDQTGLSTLADEFSSDVIQTFQADLTRKAECDAAIDGAIRFLGGLDVLVCIAGVGNNGTLHETDEELWDNTIALNLKTTYLTVHAGWPHLVDGGGGLILTTGSLVSFWGYPGLAAYSAAKGGVLVLTKCLAIDGAPYGIRANAVCPGDTETPNSQRYYDSLPDPVEARRLAHGSYPLGRFAQPADIASAFAFLASDEASYMTGTQLVLDGGRTCGFWSGPN